MSTTPVQGAGAEDAHVPHHSPLTTHPSPLTKKLLRGLLGLGILAYLLSQSRSGQVAGTLRALDMRYWAAAAGVYLAGQALCAWKWGVLARSLGMKRPYRNLLAYYYGGMFANLFLPTTVGGDLGRALALTRPDGTLSRALISVLADRGSGFTALLLIASAAAAGMPELPAGLRAATLGATLLLLLGGLGAFLFPHLFRRLGSTLHGAILACRRPATLAPVLLLSLLFQAIIVGAHFLMGRALGMAIPVSVYMLAATLVAVVAMAPISVNGLGTRDAAFVYFLGLAHVPRETAIVFALSWLALIVVCSGIGGLVCVLLAPGQMAVFTRREETVPSGQGGR